MQHLVLCVFSLPSSSFLFVRNRDFVTSARRLVVSEILGVSHDVALLCLTTEQPSSGNLRPSGVVNVPEGDAAPIA